MARPSNSNLLVVALLGCWALSMSRNAANAQSVVPTAGLDLVPEPMAVGAPKGAAEAPQTTISPEHAATTTAALRKHSRAEAAAALRRARSWRPLLNGPASTAGVVQPEAICGANTLVPDNSYTNCRIVVSFSGSTFTCSAFKIGDRLLGTAGHCIYQKSQGGFATSVDVYCTGSSTCGVQRTTYATGITTTPSWIASPTNIPTAWDGAVIKTADVLPGTAFTLAQYAGPGTYQVKLTGYPAQSGDPGCETNAFAGACSQYSSTDSLTASGSGMYTSDQLDLCSGHSGSGVQTADGKQFAVAVVSGASFSPCANYFVPQINSDAVDSHCEKQDGGVSFACLAAKLPA